MTDRTYFIDRGELERVFNPRAARQFEILQERVAEADETTTANVEATSALQSASFVTLSANAELDNEFVLSVGPGLRLETGTGTVSLFSDAPLVMGGHSLTFIVGGPTTVVVPIAGILATRDQAETLTKKTLSAPKLSDLENCADDSAAASAGVPVGGVYRSGSQLMVRVS